MKKLIGRKQEMSLTPLVADPLVETIRYGVMGNFIQWRRVAKKIKEKAISRLIFAGWLSLISVGSVYADAYLMSRLPDPEVGLSIKELDALETRGLEGDWEVKQQFAIVFLHEYLSIFSRGDGCNTLKNKKYCRSLAERPKAGRRFLQEIVDLKAEGLVPLSELAAFQALYASYWLIAARLEAYDPRSLSCQKAVRYYEQAIANELLVHPKWSCSARKLAYMVSLGNCLEEDKQRVSDLFIKSGSCPSY